MPHANYIVRLPLHSLGDQDWGLQIKGLNSKALGNIQRYLEAEVPNLWYASNFHFFTKKTGFTAF